MIDIVSPVDALVASPKASDRYAFVSTRQVLDAMEERGWQVSSTTATKVRNPEKEGFQRHMVKLVPSDPANEIRVGGSLAQILLLNSHDLTSSITARGGFYRFACSNGLVIGNDMMLMRSPHKGDPQEIINMILGIAERLPEMAEIVHRWEQVELDRLQQLDFAEKALKLRWDKHAPILATEALHVRRHEDEGDTLWSVFNRVQENIIKGGMMGVSADAKVRQVKSVEGLGSSVSLNAELWDLAARWAA